MADSRPFKDKFPEYKKKLDALNEEFDMVFFAAIERTPNSDIAVIKIIDNNDEETKKKFGIAPIPTTSPSVLVN